MSIPNVLSTIEAFSKLSGYEINWQKSEGMLISIGCSQSVISSLQFKVSPSRMKYLGIRLCSDIENIISITTAPLIKKIKANLDKWKLINLTLCGKMYIIKMAVAPQFNYIAMMIPVTILEQCNSTDKGAFWKYLQLRSSMSSAFGLQWAEEGENKVEEFLNCRHTLHSASLFYRKMSNIQVRMCESLRLIWQENLGAEINEEIWQDVISNVGWATRDARSKFIHYKIVQRYYFTLLNLFEMGISQDSKCWKCHKELGTFLPAIWNCPVVLPFWKMVLKNLEG